MGELENNAKDKIEESLKDEEILDITTDEQYIQLEISKELTRMDKEIEVCKYLIKEGTGMFDKGIVDASYFSGFYNTLISSGLSNIQAYEAMMNRMNIIHAKEISETEFCKDKASCI